MYPLVQEAEGLWESKSQCLLPPVENRSQQQVWDTGISDKLHDDIFNMADDSAMKARLLATATKESGAWPSVLPVPHLGTKLDNNTGLHHGINIVESQKCVCGAMVDCTGTHGLSCRKSSGRIASHQVANETIRHSRGISSVLEPVGVIREDAK